MNSISDLLGNNLNEKMILKEIDKKIYIKTLQEGNKMKTIVTGIENFITDNKKIDSIVKSIKKDYGCSGTVTKTNINKDSNKDKNNNNIILTFSGDQVNVVKKYLISTGICDEQYIK